MILLILKLILCALAGLFNAACDTMKDHYGVSIFRFWDQQYWNPVNSWQNKYHRPKWIPISWSDGWHLMKSLMLNSWVIAIALPMDVDWFWNALLCRVMFGIGFKLGYNCLFIRK